MPPFYFMLHLTPQERQVIVGFIVICLLGQVIHAALMFNAKPLRWVKTSSQKIKKRLPDINRDDAKFIERIDGIGPKTAQRIVEYRQTHGAFQSLEDLKKVKGITKKNFQKIKAFYVEANGHEH